MPNETNNPKAMQAPWMEEDKPQENNMLMVHMGDDELEGLDNLQGGPSIDPETGIREYSALGPMIENEEVRNTVKMLYEELVSEGPDTQKIGKVYEETEKTRPRYEPTEAEEHDPLKEIEHTGRRGDTKLALLPPSLVEFLIEIQGKPSINPKTGLLEFGWLNKNPFSKKGLFGGLANTITKRPLKAALTVAGAMLGGPLAAGAGNYIGGRMHGESHGRAFQSAAPTAALGYGAQGVGQAFGMLGGSPNYLAQGLGHMGIGSAAGSMAPGALGAAGAAIAPTAAPSAAAAAAPAAGGFMSNLMSPLGIGALGMGALGYLGSKHQGKMERGARNEEKAEAEEMRERLGYNIKHTAGKKAKKIENPNYHEHLNEAMREREEKYGIPQEPKYIWEPFDSENKFAKGGSVKSYKEGTLLRGPGKGQDDKIKTSVPDGSYIIDASSISMLGDGSTTAGNNVLAQFERHIRKKFPKKLVKNVIKDVGKNARQVPVWLSEGERKIDPVTVTLLGKGSNEKGAHHLREMVIKLRKHKISNGHGLPPKAKPLSSYIKGL